MIHAQAKKEVRSVSGYMLRILLQVVALDEQYLRYVPPARPKRPRTIGPRTSMLVRCSADEARRIRSAANRKRLTTSSFVLEQLRRSWKITGAAIPDRV